MIDDIKERSAMQIKAEECQPKSLTLTCLYPTSNAAEIRTVLPFVFNAIFKFYV